MFLLSLLLVGYREPVGIPMEVYNKDSYRMKMEDQSPLLLVCAVHVPGFGNHEQNFLIETFQVASEYIAAYPNISFDFGLYMEEGSKAEDVFVTINHPNVTSIPLFIDQNTLPKVLANDMMQEAYRIIKTFKKKRDDDRNPNISKINAKIRVVEKLIRTAVDKSDARLNQKKKEELQEKLKEYYPPDKIQRMRLKNEIRACINETEKAELEAKLAELKANRDTSKWTPLDFLAKALHDAAKEIAEARKMLDDAQELKDLNKHREDMGRYADYYGDGDEDRSFAELMSAAADVADNETERKEYKEKAEKFRKLGNLRDEIRINKTREREERKRKEKIAKKKAELEGNDTISLPEELFESDDENATDTEGEEYENGEEYGEGNPDDEENEEEGDNSGDENDEEEQEGEREDEGNNEENENEEEEPEQEEQKEENQKDFKDRIKSQPHEDAQEIAPEDL